MTQPNEKKPSLIRRAFANQYNYILIGAAGLFAITTFSWVPLLLGAGVEALWLVLGADSSLFKRWVAIQEGKERQAEIERKAREAIATLAPGYLARFKELETIGEDIRRLASDNPSLENQLIQAEMDKLGGLLHSFLGMAVIHQRLEAYLQESYEAEIQRDIDGCRVALERERNPALVATVRQSMSLAEKRLRQHQSIEATYKVVSVKMDTLEKSFRYLKSHVIGMGSQEELAREIDDLITGVEVVEDLDAETDGMLHDIGRARAARQGVKA